MDIDAMEVIAQLQEQLSAQALELAKRGAIIKKLAANQAEAPE